MQYALGALNQTDQYGYDANGNRTSHIDPKNHPATSNVYDSLDRLIKVTDPANGITQYQYNTLDQVTTPNGAVTTYTLDALNNTLTESSPDRGSLQATYDEAGNRKTLLDARPITATYAYDALNRLKTISYPSNTENISNRGQTTLNYVNISI